MYVSWLLVWWPPHDRWFKMKRCLLNTIFSTYQTLDQTHNLLFSHPNHLRGPCSIYQLAAASFCSLPKIQTRANPDSVSPPHNKLLSCDNFTVVTVADTRGVKIEFLPSQSSQPCLMYVESTWDEEKNQQTDILWCHAEFSWAENQTHFSFQNL